VNASSLNGVLESSHYGLLPDDLVERFGPELEGYDVGISHL